MEFFEEQRIVLTYYCTDDDSVGDVARKEGILITRLKYIAESTVEELKRMFR